MIIISFVLKQHWNGNHKWSGKNWIIYVRIHHLVGECDFDCFDTCLLLVGTSGTLICLWLFTSGYILQLNYVVETESIKICIQLFNHYLSVSLNSLPIKCFCITIFCLLYKAK